MHPSRPSCAWSPPAPLHRNQRTTTAHKNTRAPRTLLRFRPRATATPSGYDERRPLTPPAAQEDHIWRNGVMTDSVLEIKWRGEQQTPTSTSVPLPTPPQLDDPSAICLFGDDDLSASDPYKSFARFTRIAAPTVSLQVPATPRDLSYSSAAIVQRLLQYAHAKDNLERFVQLFSGDFDNYEQIASDLLFAKYYFNGNSRQVFRSRLYQVNARDDSERGVIEMRIFRFYEETERLLKAANYDIDAIQWDRNDVYDWMQGCEVFWERYVPPADEHDEACQVLGIEGGPRFVGYMKGGGCEVHSREIGARIKVMDDLLLTSEDLWVADRGFDLNDHFIYGNRLGIPYKMKRVRRGSSAEWTLSKEHSPPEGYVS